VSFHRRPCLRHPVTGTLANRRGTRPLRHVRQRVREQLAVLQSEPQPHDFGIQLARSAPATQPDRPLVRRDLLRLSKALDRLPLFIPDGDLQPRKARYGFAVQGVGGQHKRPRRQVSGALRADTLRAMWPEQIGGVEIRSEVWRTGAWKMGLLAGEAGQCTSASIHGNYMKWFSQRVAIVAWHPSNTR
jgi:hypothetical protein